jgi:hypothetical protein
VPAWAWARHVRTSAASVSSCIQVKEAVAALGLEDAAAEMLPNVTRWDESSPHREKAILGACDALENALSTVRERSDRSWTYEVRPLCACELREDH